ncbi:hypothetical protein DBR42_00925 [Pelomonas sp. HMWF004]|nr:hypothetical protein DBR42_00925 [Pelomonas sp. HMWF004]
MESKMFVNWPGAERLHTLATRQSGGLEFDKQTQQVSSATGKPLMTRCGREVPRDNVTGSLTIPDGKTTLDICGVCAHVKGL